MFWLRNKKIIFSLRTLNYRPVSSSFSAEAREINMFKIIDHLQGVHIIAYLFENFR